MRVDPYFWRLQTKQHRQRSPENSELGTLLHYEPKRSYFISVPLSPVDEQIEVMLSNILTTQSLEIARMCYPLVNKHKYGKSLEIVDVSPLKMVDLSIVILDNQRV